jgi:hypothetical protein
LAIMIMRMPKLQLSSSIPAYHYYSNCFITKRKMFNPYSFINLEICPHVFCWNDFSSENLSFQSCGILRKQCFHNLPPWSKALTVSLQSLGCSQNSLHLWNPEFTKVHHENYTEILESSPHLETCSFKIHFTTIILSALKPSKCTFLYRSPNQNSLCS